MNDYSKPLSALPILPREGKRSLSFMWPAMVRDLDFDHFVNPCFLRIQ